MTDRRRVSAQADVAVVANGGFYRQTVAGVLNITGDATVSSGFFSTGSAGTQVIEPSGAFLVGRVGAAWRC
jgi:hypothetical protein